MGNALGPWGGPSWTPSATGTDGPRWRVVLIWAVGVVVLLGALGAGGPQPVVAALPLPPADTSEVGATGRVPEAGAAPLPTDLLPTAPGLPLPQLGDGAGSGVPETMLAAYRGAEASLGASAPGCRLTWALVAGIGKVESGHAYGGAVGADGTTVRPILGPQLDGTGGNAAITDTDGGALDRDTVWDRAVGPTQFIPTSWRTYGADGDGNGTADPDNAFDAALATGRYLCAGGTDLGTASGRHDAVFRYNHSESYVATVLRWADVYASGALPVPDTDGGIPDPDTTGSPTLAAFPTPGAGAVPADAGLVGGSPVAAPAPAPAPAPVPIAPDPRAGLVGGSPVGPGVAPPAGNPAPANPSGSGGASSGPAPSSSGTTSPPAPRPGGSRTPAAPASSSTPAATSTPPSTTPTSTTPPSTTPTSTTPAAKPVDVARLCTASVPSVAAAFGVPAGELTATTKPGPKPGQVTCTVSRSGKPLVVAVAAATGDAAAPSAGTGTTRSARGGRVALSSPAAPATAAAALAKVASAWG